MTVTATTEAVIPAGTWNIDPTHSTIEFAVRHLGIATVKGRANGFNGTIAGGDAPSIEGAVPVASLTTFDETRDGHLLAPDFFDAERHPELRFVSRSIERDGDELVVTGDLTIKGVTREVELRGEVTGANVDPWGNERVGLEATGQISRSDYGMKFALAGGSGNLVVGDKVKIDIDVSAVRAS